MSVCVYVCNVDIASITFKYVFFSVFRTAKRHHLLCPYCSRTQDMLSIHLRRVCMKKETPEAIDAVVEKTKSDAHELLESGRVFQYKLLQDIMSDADPLGNLVKELRSRNMAVIGCPSGDIAPTAMTVTAPQIQPKDCWAVLKAAKGDFLKLISREKTDTSSTLSLTQAGFVMTYLQAVVILKYLQQPVVVEQMTVSIISLFIVSFIVMYIFFTFVKLPLLINVIIVQVNDWLGRTSLSLQGAIIAVMDAKTQNVTTFAITPEEETVSTSFL